MRKKQQASGLISIIALLTGKNFYTYCKGIECGFWRQTRKQKWAFAGEKKRHSLRQVICLSQLLGFLLFFAVLEGAVYSLLQKLLP